MKKKIFLTLIAFVLALPSAFLLAGCGEKHKHDFNTTLQYEIVEEADGKEVYSFHECECGEKDENVLVENATILSQDSSDKNYYKNHLKGTTISDKLFILESGAWGRLPIGFGLKNVVFSGVEGTVFNNEFYVSVPTSLKLENLTICNIKFETTASKILVATQSDNFDGLLIDNCDFDTKGQENTKQAILIMSSAEQVGTAKNIVIKNSKMQGYKQGVLIYGGQNVTVEGCEFLNTSHNGLALQTKGSSSNNPNYFCTGNIVIKNNKFVSPDDRAIRFGVVKNATIEISGNEFSDVKAEDDGTIELIKTQNIFNTTFKIKSNNYENRVVSNFENVFETYESFIYSAN